MILLSCPTTMHPAFVTHVERLAFPRLAGLGGCKMHVMTAEVQMQRLTAALMIIQGQHHDSVLLKSCRQGMPYRKISLEQSYAPVYQYRSMHVHG